MSDARRALAGGLRGGGCILGVGAALLGLPAVVLVLVMASGLWIPSDGWALLVGASAMVAATTAGCLIGGLLHGLGRGMAQGDAGPSEEEGGQGWGPRGGSSGEDVADAEVTG